MPVTRDVLVIDAEKATREIGDALRTQVLAVLRRRGIVVGLSGGVDSAVVAALAARALGRHAVLGVLMPERDASKESLTLGRSVADRLEIPHEVEDVTRALDGAGCYERQTSAIREVFPSYGEGWTCKLTTPSLADGDRITVFQLTVRSPEGAEHASRMPPAAYRQLVAATNMKQRTRKAIEYYHADRLGYAVAGTPNRLEYELGFFVKQGDGAADVKPIAHLYKTQVYALAAHLGVPEAIRSRPPTTDTFSMPQTQEEFFFALPYADMDLCLWALDHGVAASEIAPTLDRPVGTVERVFRDIEAKRRTTRYLHTPPLLVGGDAAGT